MLGQVFNTTSYFQRKNVIETLIDSKSKVKDTLGEQFGCLNGASNQILFAEHFENEFSKSAYAKQNPNKASFAGLQKQWTKANYITKSMNVNTRSTYNFPGLTYHQQQPIKGRSLQHCLTGRGQLFSTAFQRECKNKSIGISSNKTFKSSGFSKCTSVNKKGFSEERDSQYASSRETNKEFCKEFAKSNQRTSNPELFGSLQDPLSRDTIPEFFFLQFQ